MKPPPIEYAKRSHSQRKQEQLSTRERLLERGVARVLEAGWSATSIDVVLRECGVPKGSFYHYFQSKDAFGLALISHYQDLFTQRLEKWFGAEQDALIQGDEAWLRLEAALQGLMRESAQEMARFDFKRGCLIGCLGQEVASLNEPVRLALLECLLEWEKSLVRPVIYCILCYQNNSISMPLGDMARGSAGGSVRDVRAKRMVLAQAQAQALVREFWVNWQGAVLRCLLARDAQALEAVMKQFLHAVKAWLWSWKAEFEQRAQPTAATKRKWDAQNHVPGQAAQALVSSPTSNARSRKKHNEIKDLQQSLDL
jgi:TetR/AcrR family transcriptional regulator, transcriptional repressor for nem operon